MLGTHRLGGLNGAMGATAVLGHVHVLASLTSTLSHSLPACSVTDINLANTRGAHCDFRRCSDNGSWGESLSLALSWIDLVLLDYGCLVAGADIDFVLGADAASWVGAQVFDLADMATCLALHVVQDYS